MQENKSSNYDKLSEEWRLKFLEMDKELVKKKLPEIRQENDIFLITHFGENFVWGIDFRLGEYPCFMIYKWIIVDNRSKNRQLLQINLLMY